MKKVILFTGLIISIFILGSCYTIEKAAWHYKYHFKKNDKLYIQSFQNNDSLSLTNMKDIQFVLSLDSLIVLEDTIFTKEFYTIITKKFYKDYFEIYEKISSTNLCIYKYFYSGSIISILYYSQNKLQSVEVNENGKMRFKYLVINTPRF